MNTNTPQGSEKYNSAKPDDHEMTALVPFSQVVSAVVADEHASWTEVTTAFLYSGVDSQGTRRAYGRHLRKAGELFGQIPVAQLTGADLTDYRAHVLASGHAPSTQAQALSALRSFLHWTGSLGAHRLPAEVISVALRTPRATVQTRYSVATEKEIAAMLTAAPTAREKAIVGVLLGAGLRVQELVNLQVADILEDDEGVSLFVNQGKGRKDRLVPVGPDVAGLVKDYLAATRRYLMGSGPLFLAEDRGASRRNNPGLSTRAVSRMIGELARNAGINAKKLSPHALRHTYAVRCLRSGGNAVAVQRLLGHSSLVTTQRYVEHLAVSELRSTVPPLPFPPPDEMAS